MLITQTERLRFIQIRRGRPSRSVSIRTAVSLYASAAVPPLPSPRPPSAPSPPDRAWRVTACGFPAGVWTPSDQCRTKGRSGGRRGGDRGGATQLVIDSEFKVWKSEGDSSARGEQTDKRGEDWEALATTNVIRAALTSIWDVLTFIIAIDCVYLRVCLLAVSPVLNRVCRGDIRHLWEQRQVCVSACLLSVCSACYCSERACIKHGEPY